MKQIHRPAAALLLALLLMLSACAAPAPETAQAADVSGRIGPVASAGLRTATELLLRGISSGGGKTDPRLRPALVDVASAQSATVMVYMVGSDLESSSGLASQDLEEILRADLGDSVNVVIQTMGCHRWENESISPASSQRFTVEDGTLVCQEESLGQLDSTDPATLRDFISYCADRYPADRNILILWDHGGGPVYGFGYDEFRPSYAALTLDEMQSALAEAGVVFDFIGFDACLMGCLETGYALREYADWLICSEDFVSGFGWEYQHWLTRLGRSVSMDTRALGRVIVDTYVTESERARDRGVLALVDLQYMEGLFDAWAEFAYANESDLTASNYSWQSENTGRGRLPARETTMSDYYITDLLSLAEVLPSGAGDTLTEALEKAVVYSAATREDSAYTGLAVTLPYGDADFYADLTAVFSGCGFDEEYLAWLECFTTADGAGIFFNGWDDLKQSVRPG